LIPLMYDVIGREI